MPDTYVEFNHLKSLCTENTVLVKDENTSQHFSWVNDISYRGSYFDVLELT